MVVRSGGEVLLKLNSSEVDFSSPYLSNYKSTFRSDSEPTQQRKNMTYYLGIDIGTSGTKTLLIDDTGKVHAEANAEYPLHQPKPGWTEQDPEDYGRRP